MIVAGESDQDCPPEKNNLQGQVKNKRSLPGGYGGSLGHPQLATTQHLPLLLRGWHSRLYIGLAFWAIEGNMIRLQGSLLFLVRAGDA